MRGVGSREEPPRESPFARKRPPLRRRTDSGDVENNGPQDAARLRRAQHVASRPCTPTPPERCLDSAEEVAYERTPSSVGALQTSRPQQSSGLRPEREGPHVDEIEGE